MIPDNGVRERLFAIFRVEAHEHLKVLVTHLLALDKEEATASERRDAFEGMLRATHTLKGAARSVGAAQIEGPCQAVESVMSRLVRGELAADRGLVELLRDTVAHIARVLTGAQEEEAARALIARLEAAAGAQAKPQAPPPAPAASAAPPAAAPGPAAPDDTIRVSTTMVDSLLFRVEELSLAKLAADERVRAVGVLLGAIASAHKAPGPADWHGLEAMGRAVLSEIRADAQSLARTVDALQYESRRMRMAPAATVLDLLPIVVHDLAREGGKEVDFAVEGAHLALDRGVLERLKDPLLHLLRNAIDHGIEQPDQRVAAGKPPRGRLTLSLAAREGGRAEIRLADDGAGVDVGQVREAAVRSRLMSADEAQTADDDAVRELIFRSGLSTSPIVTHVSGRGLGMAIVKEQVERLGGTVTLTSEPGQGAVVGMVVPVAITTFHGLVVRVGGQPVVIPTDAVERVWRVKADEIVAVEGRPTVVRDGRSLPCVHLSAALTLGAEDDPARATVCVGLRVGEQRVALLVEQVEGTREVLIKEFQFPLVRVRNVAAAGVLGTGEMVLVLRPADLVRDDRTHARPPVPKERAQRQSVVLVVDDSITTRAVERDILEAEGYRVLVAADGVEALDVLAREACDLVVSDVDMPSLNGFELTQRIRDDPKLKDLPIVLVTALESRDDKERGIRLGANAYVFKSTFAQSNLTDIIAQLLQ